MGRGRGKGPGPTGAGGRPGGIQGGFGRLPTGRRSPVAIPAAANVPVPSPEEEAARKAVRQARFNASAASTPPATTEAGGPVRGRAAPPSARTPPNRSPEAPGAGAGRGLGAWAGGRAAPGGVGRLGAGVGGGAMDEEEEEGAEEGEGGEDYDADGGGEEEEGMEEGSTLPSAYQPPGRAQSAARSRGSSAASDW